VQIKHACQSCGAVMEVHNHDSWLEIKLCDRNRRALCAECDSWPGSPKPLAPEGTRSQEGVNGIILSGAKSHRWRDA
jgi:hypothetical protein